MLEGGHAAVQADEDVVGASQVRELEKRVRDLISRSQVPWRRTERTRLDRVLLRGQVLGLPSGSIGISSGRCCLRYTGTGIRCQARAARALGVRSQVCRAFRERRPLPRSRLRIPAA